MKSTKAFGRHYFSPTGFPITVKSVPAGSGPQHPYDLTETLHYHDFAELIIITAGNGIHVINDVEYPVTAGDVFLIQGFSEHHFKSRQSLSHVNVMYDSARLPLSVDWLRKIPGYNVIFELEPNWREHRNFKHRLHLSPARLAHAETIIQSMLEETRENAPGYEAVLFSMLLELIVYISRQYDHEASPKTVALVRIGNVISKLEQEHSRAWKLPEIAKLAGMSASNLLILFKMATGVSPIDYVIKIRLRRAATDLCSSANSISEIAFEHGFRDSNYFSKKFKQVYDMSPRKYRQKFRT
ncbi:MAG: helix-turn-helix domain-containing protein [Lentisphaerae bacterium]|nr:helix-turn-helix domain-containing protein [Lentisphaerota bacterium]MCP4099809.1 helix-turn-helix domain-containing protein [Lentisphaerota bacterium]